MIPWNEQYDELQGRVTFAQNKYTLEWQLGTPMPHRLPQDIVQALDLEGSGTSPELVDY
jgi:hypothetical protein